MKAPPQYPAYVKAPDGANRLVFLRQGDTIECDAGDKKFMAKIDYIDGMSLRIIVEGQPRLQRRNGASYRGVVRAFRDGKDLAERGE